MDLFQVQVLQGSTPRVVVTGEVDASVAVPFEHALLQAVFGSDGPVEIDMAGVEFLDVAGLRALLDVVRSADRGERSVAIVRPSGAVRLVADASRTAPLLDFA